MKTLIAAAVAASTLALAGAAGAQPMHRHVTVSHHGHKVKVCTTHHHHRVCRMEWR